MSSLQTILFRNDDLDMGGEHKCSVCDATFTRPQHVARHMRSHTGDRPYRCQFCPDQFARSDLLSRHVNKCHEAEKPPPGPSGRKPSRAALRATTSKQICDQCVKSSLSCDGAKPCLCCTQRKIRCTFVEFNRQTAPTGPGHPDHDVQPLPFSTAALQPDYTAPQQQFYHLDYAPSPTSQMNPTEFNAYPAPEAFNSAFGVLSIHDPDAAPFFSPDPTAGILTDPNATPMSRDDLTWTQLTTPQTRRRAASMFSVRTPTAVPPSYLPTNTYVPAPVHAAVPLETLSSWSAKIHSQPPPELHLDPPASKTKFKARRQTLSGAPLLYNPHVYDMYRDHDTDTDSRDSASPVDPHSRSSSLSSWEESSISAPPPLMRPAFKRLPSATPLEHNREHKRLFISTTPQIDHEAVVDNPVPVPVINMNLAQRRRTTSVGGVPHDGHPDLMFNFQLGNV